MSASTTPRGVADESGKLAWAAGLELFAGIVMVTLGAFPVIQGIAAVANDHLYVSTTDYTFHWDLTAWGWGLIILGALVIGTGAGLVAHQDWARAVGLVLAVFSALANFTFLPYYPVWSLMVIVFDVAVIWALTTLFGRERPE